MTPLEATRESMREISKVVIGIALIFVGGIFTDGILWQLNWGDLSPVLVTLINGMALSALVALIFTLPYIATILKRTKARMTNTAGIRPVSLAHLTVCLYVLVN